MRFKKYITEAKANRTVRKEVEDFLKLNPDIIIYNAKPIRKTNDVDFLFSLLNKPQDTVSIMKYTLEGNLGIQLYLDKNKIKIDRIIP